MCRMVVIEDPLFRSPCARRAGRVTLATIAWSMVHARSRHRPLSALCANDFLAPTSATDSTSSGALAARGMTTAQRLSLTPRWDASQ